MLKAIEIEIAFFHSLEIPRVAHWIISFMLHKSHIRHNFPYKLIPISISYSRSRVWIVVRPTENDSTRLYKNGDISVVISCS